MQVRNSSKIIKNLKVGVMILSFPPGISGQPEIPKVLEYVANSKDLSIFKEEVKVPVPEKKKQKPVKVKDDKPKKPGSEKPVTTGQKKKPESEE